MNIYLTGPDGSGKSTLLDAIKNEFRNRGIKTTTVWIRSPKIFSKPLMAYCRLMGYTKYFVKDGVKYGYHDFSRSKLVSFVFPILQYFDLRITLLFRKKNNGVILYDRFVLDTLADLMVSTRHLNLHKTIIGRLFLSLMPSSTKVFVIMVDESIIRQRKLDTLHDPNLSVKLRVYDILAKDLGFDIINNNGKIDETLITLKNKIFYR
ncbi:MAG TPA: hypothetical protein PK591_11180 [Ignavibacteriales bacterium]|nr:hypothetical protein [Ignavibacteriales bacterium]